MRARRLIAAGVLTAGAFSSTIAGFAIAGTLGKAFAAGPPQCGPVSGPVSGQVSGPAQNPGQKGQNPGQKGQNQCPPPPPPPPPLVPFNVTYAVDCEVLAFHIPVTLNIVGQAPSTTTPGAPVSLSGVQTTLSLPADVVNNTLAVDFGITSWDTAITADNINATNTTEGTVNATPTPVDFTVNLIENQPVVQVLNNTPETVGTWTAGSSGTIVFTPGDLDVTLTSGPGQPFGGLSESVACTPLTTPTLASVVIP